MAKRTLRVVMEDKKKKDIAADAGVSPALVSKMAQQVKSGEKKFYVDDDGSIWEKRSAWRLVSAQEQGR